MEQDATETLTATIIGVGPYGVAAERHWGNSDATGTRTIHIHESDSPGITRHAVGDTIKVRAAYTLRLGRVRLREDN
jgi:hypothetical protein